METLRMEELTTNLKVMMSEYTDDKGIDEESDEMKVLKNALKALDDADKIIFLIYCETRSLRQTGKILGVSHTIVYKLIKDIRKKLYDIIKNDSNNCNNLLLNRFERYCNINKTSNLEMGV